MAGAEARSAVLFDDIDLETLKPSFNRIVRVAMALFDAEYGDVMIRVGEKVWRNSGDHGQSTPVSELVEQTDDVFWVHDAPTDTRVIGRLDQRILERRRFYAGAPIRLADGRQIGVISVCDRTPRPYEERLAKRLRDLAGLIGDEFQRHTAILARARAEAEAHAARATLASIVESAPMALVMTDKEMRIVRASPRWRSERGLTGAEIEGRSMYELFPGSQTRWQEGFERALAGHAVHGDRIGVTLPDGSQKWIRSEHTPWRDATGEIGGLMLMSVDITDMVEALETASRTQQRLELALQIGDLHMWEADYKRMAVTAGGAASTLDYDRDLDFADVEDDNIWRIVHPADRPAAMALWERYMADGTPFRTEFRLLQMNGPHRWAQAAAAATRDETGEVTRVIGVIRDIDAEKRGEIALAKARDAAEAANRAKSEFLANMSHEIRTPLNGVMGVASALSKTNLDPAQREMVGLVESSAQTLESLLSDVLDLARIESGRLELKAEPFDLVQAVEDVGALFFPAARDKGLKFVVQAAPEAQGRFVGDAGRVRQILSNLVSNAVKFTTSGSVTLKVETQTDVAACDEVLVLSVSDTGIGFDDEAATRLFGRFEQADGSITRRYGGTGLGLAISQSLAQAMGGQLYATSLLDEGSVFTLRLALPRVKAPSSEAPPPEAAEAEPVDMSRFRVLLAEDHHTNRRVVELILGSAGVALTCVENGAEAVEAFEAEDFDLILMDMQMPVMDGLTAIRAIRQCEAAAGKRPTVIFALTANAMPEHSKAS
ncbi:MAG TPA: ATP-binding protein, partial [Caulobacteraceae bacterium]|nr:ATP-binding protein [Caulobacteraceae bacterium]